MSKSNFKRTTYEGLNVPVDFSRHPLWMRIKFAFVVLRGGQIVLPNTSVTIELHDDDAT